MIIAVHGKIAKQLYVRYIHLGLNNLFFRIKFAGLEKFPLVAVASINNGLVQILISFKMIKRCKPYWTAKNILN